MSEETKSLNFIEHIIEEDLRNGMLKEKLRFRFPPEPNGYLHIGHTKAIGISFGLGETYNARVNLRFDDTNPVKEEQEFVDAIKKDIKWLGYKWDKECYSSDYFQQLYDWAILLIKKGKSNVDSQTSEAMAIQKWKTSIHWVYTSTNFLIKDGSLIIPLGIIIQRIPLLIRRLVILVTPYILHRTWQEVSEAQIYISLQIPQEVGLILRI